MEGTLESLEAKRKSVHQKLEEIGDSGVGSSRLIIESAGRKIALAPSQGTWAMVPSICGTRRSKARAMRKA